MLAQIKSSAKRASKKGMLLKTKKAAVKRSKKIKSNQLATDFSPAMDPAHEQGHKKMNLKNEFSKATGIKTRTKMLRPIFLK